MDVKKLNRKTALKMIENSEYTLEEIKKDWKKDRCPSYKKGFWASRGIDWRNGQFIEQVLL